MKKYIAGIATGIILSCTVALAVSYTATQNPFTVKLNGNNVNIEGYNIDGSTYFKLRDVADTVGGFEVGFDNDTIQLAKDGYVYENESKEIVLDESIKNYLAECCMRIPDFTPSDLNNEDFVESFIFNYYAGGIGASVEKQLQNGYFVWTEKAIQDEYKLLFGVEMPTFHPKFRKNILYENGNYKISAANYGDQRYEFINAVDTKEGTDVIYKQTDSEGTDFGIVTLHLVPSDNKNGYVITSKIKKNEYGYSWNEMPDNSQAKEILKQYADKHIKSLYDPDNGDRYNDVRFMLEDISGDDFPELFAVGIYDNKLHYMEIYKYENGLVEKIYEDHCQGYHGGSSSPILYNGGIYVWQDHYSSSWGFLKDIIEYRNGEWKTAYFSKSSVEDYVVNNNVVSQLEYETFNSNIKNAVLPVSSFVASDKL